ncbi:hypothetical protein GCM10009855_18050 [Gordonia cholesterolivorans]|uniref:Uncharacterized protein n=1 Tax=Gordonia cholesterolivorans TaxID=559625 RepID=A0ABN3HFB3_9ACTN
MVIGTGGVTATAGSADEGGAHSAATTPNAATVAPARFKTDMLMTSVTLQGGRRAVRARRPGAGGFDSLRASASGCGWFRLAPL